MILYVPSAFVFLYDLICSLIYFYWSIVIGLLPKSLDGTVYSIINCVVIKLIRSFFEGKVKYWETDEW